MGGKRIRGLKVWRECCISKERARWARLSCEVYKLEESKEEVAVLVGVRLLEEAGTQQGKQL